MRLSDVGECRIEFPGKAGTVAWVGFATFWGALGLGGVLMMVTIGRMIVSSFSLLQPHSWTLMVKKNDRAMTMQRNWWERLLNKKEEWAQDVTSSQVQEGGEGTPRPFHKKGSPDQLLMICHLTHTRYISIHLHIQLVKKTITNWITVHSYNIVDNPLTIQNPELKPKWIKGIVAREEENGFPMLAPITFERGHMVGDNLVRSHNLRHELQIGDAGVHTVYHTLEAWGGGNRRDTARNTMLTGQIQTHWPRQGCL